jgi:hypothetical protein
MRCLFIFILFLVGELEERGNILSIILVTDNVRVLADGMISDKEIFFIC